MDSFWLWGPAASLQKAAPGCKHPRKPKLHYCCPPASLTALMTSSVVACQGRSPACRTVWTQRRCPFQGRLSPCLRKLLDVACQAQWCLTMLPASQHAASKGWQPLPLPALNSTPPSSDPSPLHHERFPTIRKEKKGITKKGRVPRTTTHCACAEQVDAAISTMGAAIAPPSPSGAPQALSTPKWNARPLVPQACLPEM